MKKASVYVHNIFAGILTENEDKSLWTFTYTENYQGEDVSLTMPISQKAYTFDKFPPFFEGLLPEGIQLEGLLRLKKIDRNDLLSQLLAVGNDTVGAVTVQAIKEDLKGE